MTDLQSIARQLACFSDAVEVVWNRYQEYGPGETRHCVAIFNPLDSEADTITIDLHGLINDIALENLGDGRFRVTERVLRIVFERPGDEFYTSLDQFKLKSKNWITLTSETGKKGE